MYFVWGNLVILGVDGFIRDPQMGSQFRVFCFGLNVAMSWGDIDPDGNRTSIYWGLQRVYEVL